MKKSAFTLIELLVVIAIIAILLSILMPALRLARDQANAIMCQSNLRALTLSWLLYKDDYDGKLVGGFPNREVEAWVKPPRGSSTDPIERQLQGIREGLLFPYNKNVRLYRCPGDRRKQTPGQEAYGSYSIAGGLNGEEKRDDGTGEHILLYTEIQNAATKFVFVEECDPRGWNMGSWIVHHGEDRWIDPVAIWHNKRSCLGWADGHAEKHKWVDKSTMYYAQLAADGNKDVFDKTPFAGESIEDLHFMQKGYQLKGKTALQQ